MISVCMATYNGAKYIKEQLDSILNQLSDDDEIIISDDSSSDNTVEIILTYNDPRIKLHRDQKFKSPIYNFENAIKQAKGDFIFLCDQDDVWFPDKIKTSLFYLQKYDLVVSDCKMVDENLNVFENSFFAVRNSGKGFWKNLVKNSYIGCCMAFRREIIKYALPFPSKVAMHDIWIGLSVELNGSSYFIDKPLILYRRHNENVSFGVGGSDFSLGYQMKYRLWLLFQLLKRKLTSFLKPTK